MKNLKEVMRMNKIRDDIHEKGPNTYKKIQFFDILVV